MRNSIIILLSFLVFVPVYSQDTEGTKDPPLFERLPGFSILDYTLKDIGAYRFCDENGDNLIVEGMISYYYYECDGSLDPQKIINKFKNAVIGKGGKVYGDEPNQKYMVYRDSIKLVWVDLYAEDFYYTLNIIEKIERISVITPEDITKSLTEKGEAILYFNFDRGDCTLKEECKPVLETLAEVLKADPTINLSVIAYTDNAGRASDNKLLSENRAKTLCTRLVELGIDESRLISEGRGEEDPIADNSTLEGRSMNSRIVLYKN